MSFLYVGVLFVCVQFAVSQLRGVSTPRPGGSAADSGKNWVNHKNGYLHPGPFADFPTPSGCCDWPSCFDERTQLCLNTCLMTWSQCPKKLFLMTCYSEYMSPFGALPLQCFPDAAPHIEEAEEMGITGSAKEV